MKICQSSTWFLFVADDEWGRGFTCWSPGGDITMARGTVPPSHEGH